jgi:putative FmdB family regulatory protein
MPIYEISCRDCGHCSEVLVLDSHRTPTCPNCGGDQTEKLISATSTLTGKEAIPYPGAGDTACCGSTPSRAGCAGPGSCCGKTK